MRFLGPLIVIGAILASQVVLAAPSPSVPSWSGKICRSAALQRRAERALKVGRTPFCDPAARSSSSSSSSSRSTSVVPGSRVGVPCPSQATLRSALRMIEMRRPFACDPNATSFSPTVSSSSSVLSSIPTVTMDTGDTTIRSQFLLLGETGPVLGAAKIFIEEEPLDLTALSVNITAQVPSVQSLLVYDDDKRYLGRATLNTASSTNCNYRLTLAPGTFEVGKREERRVYFRAQLSEFQSGGQAGHVVQISNVTAEGNGVWSSRKYTKATSSSEGFPQFVTSRSTITKVKNALEPTGPLVTGSNQLLAAFTFEGRKSDASAHIDLTNLTFQVGQTGNITLQNVRLKTQGLPDGISCTVSAFTVVCSSIPDLLGSLTDAPRTIQLYGDIIPSGDLHASLQLTLNETGDPGNAGAVTWSDGSTSFSWVGLDGPVAAGTNWKY